jgi:hypothetical protein
LWCCRSCVCGAKDVLALASSRLLDDLPGINLHISVAAFVIAAAAVCRASAPASKRRVQRAVNHAPGNALSLFVPNQTATALKRRLPTTLLATMVCCVLLMTSVLLESARARLWCVPTKDRPTAARRTAATP